jgi:hypothetical protein
VAQLIYPGNANPADVLTGKNFSAGTNYNVAGTMPNQGAVTLTPSGTGTVAIPAGYHNGSGVVSQVNVPAANVLTGTTIAGVAGTMPNRGAPTWTPGTSNQNLAAGYYSGGTVQGDANLVAANIKSGVSIFGVAGSVTPRGYASGSVTSSSSSIVWTFDNNTTTNLPSVTVSGLTFTPTLIFLYAPSNGNTIIYLAGANLRTGGSTAPIWSGTPGSSYGFFQLTGNAYVNGSGFQLPSINASLSFNWYAFY